MTKAIRTMTFAAAALFAVNIALAQAPAGATGQCKDGTYTTNATKSGACSGHKGVKEWYAASAKSDTKSTEAKTSKADAKAAKAEAKAEAKASKADAKAAKSSSTSESAEAPAASPAPSTAAAPAPRSPMTQSASKASAANTTPAPGGGAGKVWLNTSTNVYHCQGTKYYGTTKAGAYMTEAEAQGKGAHGDRGKTCK